MKKGDFVECLESRDCYITAGSVYEVLAAEGDEDIIFGGLVHADGFIVKNDNGEDIYCLCTESCLFGFWRLQ